LRKGVLIFGLLICLLVIISGVAGATSVNVHWDGSGMIFVHTNNGNNYGELYGSGKYIVGDYFAEDDYGSFIDVDVYAYGNKANYEFWGVQELSGYTSNNVGVYSWVKGSSDVLMNLRYDQSHYVVQLERHTTSEPLLAGSGKRYNIGYDAVIFDRNTGVVSAEYFVKVKGTYGSATIDTNQWHSTVQWTYGWGKPDSINAPTPPGYYTPINYIDAYGLGKVIERGFGVNYVNWNGYEMSYGGNFRFVANYGGEFHGQPDVTVY